MKEMMIYLLAVAAAVGVRAILNRNKKEEGAPAANVDGARVFEILRLAYLDLKEQKGAGYGPWLSAALERRCGDPDVALTAVRWTLRDIQNLPVGEGVGYVPGLKFRFDLSALEAAARELEEMKEGAGLKKKRPCGG